MSAGIATRVRATIIKVPDATPGLLIAKGRQTTFTLEGRWQSPVAPQPDMAVEVDLDPSGTVIRIAVVDAKQLAKERLSRLMSLVLRAFRKS
jgi:hypothetical protein